MYNELAQVGHFYSNQAPSLPLHSHNNTFLVWDGQFILRTSKDVLNQDGRRIGSITTEKDLPQLTRSFSKIREIGKTGEFMLCAPPGDGGQGMACLLSQLGGVKFQHLPRVTEGMPLPMNYVLEGKSGVITVKDYRQVPVIAAYAPLGVFGLGMMLKLDEEELFRPVTEQLKIIVLYLAGLIIAEILLLYWLVRKLIRSEREARNAKENAEHFAAELSYKEFALRERLKEITCLYEIHRGMGLELSVDNVCQQIFEHLIPAMQFPEIAAAMIELDGRRYTSRNYSQGLTHELQSKISVNDKVCGQSRVFYPEDKPFLVLEEQRLIDALASDLEGWLDRKRLEQALVSIAEEQQRLTGQELHDNLGQQIAAISYQAKALEKKISASGSVDAATVAASIAAQAQIAVMQCKQLAQGLLPFELETNGLIATLQAFASRIAATYKITCNFVCKNEVFINCGFKFEVQRLET
jgi:signal transduction histidine kinase